MGGISLPVLFEPVMPDGVSYCADNEATDALLHCHVKDSLLHLSIKKYVAIKMIHYELHLPALMLSNLKQDFF